HERLKALDPGNYWVLLVKSNQLYEEKKYAEALALINKMVDQRGETLLTQLKKVACYGLMEKIDSMVLVLKDAYRQYPERAEVVTVMYQYYKAMMKDPPGAIKMLEQFTAHNYSYKLMDLLATEYFEQNQPDKGTAMLKALVASAPYEVETYNPLAAHFYSRQQ